MCALLKRRVEKYHQLTLEGNKMTCCYMTTNETKIKTDKQTNKQTNKKILTVLGGGTWSFLLGSQSENDYIEIPKTVALVINWWALPLDPANICWSWRRLQHVFSVKFLRLAMTSWRTKNCHAKDVLKRSWRHVLRMSWRHVLKTSWRHVLKMPWRHVLKTSSRHYGDKQKTYWGYLYLTNLNVYVTSQYFTNLHLTIIRRIQNALIRA